MLAGPRIQVETLTRRRIRYLWSGLRLQSTNSIGTIMVHLYAGKSACNTSACVLSPEPEFPYLEDI